MTLKLHTNVFISNNGSTPPINLKEFNENTGSTLPF